MKKHNFLFILVLCLFLSCSSKYKFTKIQLQAISDTEKCKKIFKEVYKMFAIKMREEIEDCKLYISNVFKSEEYDMKFNAKVYIYRKNINQYHIEKLWEYFILLADRAKYKYNKEDRENILRFGITRYKEQYPKKYKKIDKLMYEHEDVYKKGIKIYKYFNNLVYSYVLSIYKESRKIIFKNMIELRLLVLKYDKEKMIKKSPYDISIDDYKRFYDNIIKNYKSYIIELFLFKVEYNKIAKNVIDSYKNNPDKQYDFIYNKKSFENRVIRLLLKKKIV